MSRDRLNSTFFERDVLEVAPDLLGKTVIRMLDGVRSEWMISEVEAYRGEEDLACHASRGRTKRTEVMYQEGGRLYVYLIYGIYWMLNIVTGKPEYPQAVLIRGLSEIRGPGKVGRVLHIDKSFYGESVVISERIWIEKGISVPEIKIADRIGIDYAGEYWKNMKWRFFI